MVGKTFNRLTAIRQTSKDKRGYLLWIFLCACGKTKELSGARVRSGRVKSCGCLWNEPKFIKHGYEDSPTYRSWEAMKQRCLNRKSKDYPLYGAVGIKMDERWKDFRIFLKEMGERPEGTSIDRIDGSRGYFPGNCRWADRKKQNRNLKSNVELTFLGKTQCLAAWCEELGIRYPTLYNRLKKGWPIERILSRQKWDRWGNLANGNI